MSQPEKVNLNIWQVIDADPRKWPGHTSAIGEMRQPKKDDVWAWNVMKRILAHNVEGLDPFPGGLVEQILHESFLVRRASYLGRLPVSDGDSALREALTTPTKLRDRNLITPAMDVIATLLPIENAAPHFRGLLTPNRLTREQQDFYRNYQVSEPSPLYLEFIAASERARLARQAEAEKSKRVYLAAQDRAEKLKNETRAGLKTRAIQVLVDVLQRRLNEQELEAYFRNRIVDFNPQADEFQIGTFEPQIPSLEQPSSAGIEISITRGDSVITLRF